MAKSILEKSLNHFLRGAMFSGGRTIEKEITGSIKKRTLDTTSKFRRAIDRFQLTGDFKRDIKKMIGLIDSFDEEYTTTKAQFQKSWYLADDMHFIEKKIMFMQDMIVTESEQTDLARLKKLWTTYKAKHQ